MNWWNASVNWAGGSFSSPRKPNRREREPWWFLLLPLVRPSAEFLSRKQSDEIFSKSRFYLFLSNFYGVKTYTESITQESSRLSDQPALSSPTQVPRPSPWQRPWWQLIALLPLLYLGCCLGLAILIVACVAWPITIMVLGLVTLTWKEGKR